MAQSDVSILIFVPQQIKLRSMVLQQLKDLKVLVEQEVLSGKEYKKQTEKTLKELTDL